MITHNDSTKTTSQNYVRQGSGVRKPRLVKKPKKRDLSICDTYLVIVMISDFVCSLKTRLAWVSLEVEVVSGWPIKSVKVKGNSHLIANLI